MDVRAGSLPADPRPILRPTGCQPPVLPHPLGATRALLGAPRHVTGYLRRSLQPAP